MGKDQHANALYITLVSRVLGEFGNRVPGSPKSPDYHNSCKEQDYEKG